MVIISQEGPERGERVVERVGDEGVGGNDARAAVVVRGAGVLFRIERVLCLQGLPQRLVGLGERNRLDPGHQVSSTVSGIDKAWRRGATK